MEIMLNDSKLRVYQKLSKVDLFTKVKDWLKLMGIITPKANMLNVH